MSYFTHSVVTAVADRQGLFAQHGLEVVAEPVRSSPHQFGLLRDGECDLALTSPDNVAAYRGSDRNPLGQQLDVRILLAVDCGLGLSVMADPSIPDLAGLRGKVVGVDVPQSGFALALFGVLAGAGLHAGQDYQVVSLGSTPQRREALLQGRCDATLLNAGHDLAAELAGARRLAQVTDRYHPYLGAVLAGSGKWVDEHTGEVQEFVAAWLEATRRVLDPAQRDTVVGIAQEVLGLPSGAAQRFYEVLASGRDGLVADGSVDPAALETVLTKRAEHGMQSVPDEGLVDSRFA